MTLTFISLGLADKEDITVKGLNKVRQAKYIYLEHYTSVFTTPVEELEEFYGNTVILATRDMVEGDDNEILNNAKEHDVAFLVVGDVFSATTHSDLFLRAKQLGIQTEVIHNASIMTAVGMTGLQLYNFGKTTSMVFFEPDWKPKTAYDVIKMNKTNGMHTLVLLDIKVAEPTKKDLAKEQKNTQKPRFMTIHQAIEQLLEIEKERGEKVIDMQQDIIGIARAGCVDQQIVVGSASELLQVDFGGPLHSLVIPGNMHFLEEEFLEQFIVEK